MNPPDSGGVQSFLDRVRAALGPRQRWLPLETSSSRVARMWPAPGQPGVRTFRRAGILARRVAGVLVGVGSAEYAALPSRVSPTAISSGSSAAADQVTIGPSNIRDPVEHGGNGVGDRDVRLMANSASGRRATRPSRYIGPTRTHIEMIEVPVARQTVSTDREVILALRSLRLVAVAGTGAVTTMIVGTAQYLSLVNVHRSCDRTSTAREVSGGRCTRGYWGDWRS
jgi:hypothetical protein